MWLSCTLTWFTAVFFMTPLLTECVPRFFARSFQQRGPLASQKLLSSQYHTAIPQTPSKINDPVPHQREKTVSVYCHDEEIEIVMSADLFASGVPVSAEELFLGSPTQLVKASAASCGAVQTGKSQLTILAYFKDCGTKLHVTGDSVVYSNVIVYSPLPSPDGVLRQESAVIPVECHYQRRYSVDSAAVAPTWSPFVSTVSATDYLDFSLRLMNDDWQYERGSNVYFLGDTIHLQASVTLANHVPLFLFIDWCEATPTYGVVPSDIKYSFVENHGCLTDSRSLYSRSKFLQRSQGNKLNLQLEAFRFYKLTSNLVFIKCYLKAIPTAFPLSSQNRACSSIDGRWQSADGGDEVCNGCEPSKPAVADPRPIQPYHITLAPPVKQPYLAPKPKLADFYHARPGQSSEPFKSLTYSRQYASGVSKRGTDLNKDWSKIATLGPLFLIPKKETTTQSPVSTQTSPAEVLSTVTEEPELLFNSAETSPVTELEFKTDQEAEGFLPLEKGLFLNSDPFIGEGSGFEP
ncbi:zona pellucida sperm-binding protein 3b isoform X2 [Carassius gibelio]|uniref:zona pellucida sperm-binding protein 3b isoform X2 n=1 Tax=Carassius gibelio TaxID=101364 RepID=UPI002279BC62|nr:zona pellucida sperm-binding protein 3b isoform X2 [Carassius gibelio]